MELFFFFFFEGWVEGGRDEHCGASFRMEEKQMRLCEDAR